MQVLHYLTVITTSSNKSLINYLINQIDQICKWEIRIL